MLEIKSKSKNYSVHFQHEILNNLTSLGTHFIIDRNVKEIYQISVDNAIVIDANENNKSFQNIEFILKELLDKKLNRSSRLVAIGGGIIQDISCFISSIWMRGVNCVFIPTTLLSQSDSCIGSKSSINFGDIKNLLGTFNSPDEVYIDTQFIKSLTRPEILSGLGEIIKLYEIGNLEFSLEECTKDYETYVKQALLIKKKYVEEDEFDFGIRNLLNYGHCVGHAIESSTNYKVPHGIAVMIGMDIVNHFSFKNNLMSIEKFESRHKLLRDLYKEYLQFEIGDLRKIMESDKKNTSSEVNLILPVNGKIERKRFPNNSSFFNSLNESIREIYNESL